MVVYPDPSLINVSEKTNNRRTVSLINRIALFLALFYAFSTRSVLGPMVYKGSILSLYYGLLYLTLFKCLIRNIKSNYYPTLFYIQILLLFFIVAEGLARTEDLHSLLYYGIAFLTPFSLKLKIISEKRIPYSFVIIGFLLVLGCCINYFFLDYYNNNILPLYTLEKQDNIEWQLGFGTFFPGFTSQVGYTSFFLSLAIGAVFCFRKTIFKMMTFPLIACLLYGMILTGKRGPFFFTFLALITVYIIDDPNKRNYIKVVYILFFSMLLICIVQAVTMYSSNESLMRIYNAFNVLINTGTIEDLGREQLRDQAWIAFENNPLVGIGWNNFIRVASNRNTYVHNIYLQLLCECGITGFLVFLFFFISQLVTTLKKIYKVGLDDLGKSWLAYSFFIQMYFLLYGFTGNPLYDTNETILYFFAVGICNLPIKVEAENKNDLQKNSLIEPQ